MKSDSIKAALGIVNAIDVPAPLFQYSVGWAGSYHELFAGVNLAKEGIASLPEQAKSNGRVLLCGRAGSGKSVILRVVAKRTASKKSIVVLIDLSKWTARDTEQSKAASDTTTLLNFLLRRFSGLELSVLDLDLVDPAIQKTILVDGLNEVPSSVGVAVLNALDDCVTRLIGSCVVVTDRLTRRPVSETRWHLARVEALSEGAIQSALAAIRTGERIGNIPRQLLDWPFFLAKVLSDRSASESGAAALHQLFRDRVGLAEFEIQSLAIASYQAYVDSSSRSFDRALFEERIGVQVFERLIQAGVLETAEGVAYFKHHLNHDYLAAVHVAAHPEMWGYEAFNALSFQASSFDSVALAFARVPTESKAMFVRQVYDWNPYAIAFALAEEEYREADDLDEEIERVVLSMLADKRWDPVIPTSERAIDALSLFTQAKSGPFLQVESRNGLLALVQAFDSEIDWFQEWKALFCLLPDQDLDNDVLDRLGDSDSIVGWTLANVLKHFQLDEDQILRVVDFTRDERPVVRWRAVHVLGAFATEESRDSVVERFDDDADPWVRYGALRSFVELASRTSSDSRAQVLDLLIDRREFVLNDKRLKDELVRALRIRPQNAAEGWLQSAMQVLAAYLEASETIQDIDYWSRAISDLRMDYGQ